jgi:hypothetical protein
MKNLFLTILFLLVPALLLAQSNTSRSNPVEVKVDIPDVHVMPIETDLFLENFNGDNSTAGLTARGWVWINNDGGGTSTTFQGNTTVFSSYEGPADGYVGQNFNGANGFLIDQWLITPAVTVTAGDTISFWYRSTNTGTTVYPDSIFVRVSPTGGATIADFTINLGKYKVPNDTWTNWRGTFTVGGSVRVAIQYYMTNGGVSGSSSDYWGMDLFRIATGGAPVGPGPATNPSPASNAQNVAINTSLSWTNPAGVTGTQVFFGTDAANLTSVYNAGPSTSYTPTMLSYSTNYFWRVNSTDASGTTVGATWSFRTMDDPNATTLIVYDSSSVNGRASRDSVATALTQMGQTFLFWNKGGQTNAVSRSFRNFTKVYWLGEGSSVMSAVQKDSIKAYLNSGTPANKKALVIFSEDIGYQFGRTAATTYDLDFVNTYLNFNYVLDRPASGANQGLVGVAINTNQTDSTVGTWPDVFSVFNAANGDALYRHRVVADPTHVAGVGRKAPGYEVATFGFDIRSLRPAADSPAGSTVLRLVSGGTSYVPVELVSFSASVSGTSVSLNWATASEINNSGFAVERASNGEFVQIGFVAGSGSTTERRSYSFVDNAAPGSYSYRLKQIDYDGSFEYSNAIEVDVIAPAVFALGQNYPNPFNPSTKINFSLAVESMVTLKVYDLLGQEVTSLINQVMGAGSHTFNFDASKLNTGVYMYKIEASGVNGVNFTDVKKMLLMK